VGAIITLVGTLTVGVPTEVRHHNRQVAEYDDDLAQWVSDECVRLERILEAKGKSTKTKLSADEFLREAAEVKEQVLHEYRDQQTIAERKRAAMLDDEGWRHRVWRRWREPSALTAPDRAAPILDGWRDEVRRGLLTAPVSDPTQRPIDWAVERYAKDQRPWDRYTES
jgi:hypothetical protein